MVLAHGSFGLDLDSQTIGVDAVITTDLKLAARYQEKYTEIEGRFKDMVSNLPELYRMLSLPQVMTTATILMIT